MILEGKRVLVTGANRGIGKALVTEALAKGAIRVYAGMRHTMIHRDPRVLPLQLDITNDSQIDAASRQVDALDLLINNSGLFLLDDLSDRTVLERHLAVNLFGTLAVTEAFLPQLTTARGAIVNILSMSALAAVPRTPAYSISKAAAFSMTQAQRGLFAQRSIRVHAVLPGPVDTDMTRDIDMPKASAASVARAVLRAVENEQEDIFPDSMSGTVASTWRDGVTKTLERRFRGVES